MKRISFVLLAFSLPLIAVENNSYNDNDQNRISRGEFRGQHEVNQEQNGGENQRGGRNQGERELAARGGGGAGYRGGESYHHGDQAGYHSNGENYGGVHSEANAYRRGENNAYNNGADGGGGAYEGDWSAPYYPDPESQPGEGDDTDALYQHMLQKNGQGY